MRYPKLTKLRNLPSTLSGLLRVAVADAKKTAKDSRYKLDMGTWYTKYPGQDKCSVCMAGAVIAQRAGISPDTRVAVFSLENQDLKKKLLAINDMRVGLFDVAAHSLGFDPADIPSSLHHMIRENIGKRSGRAPWRKYELAADVLEMCGL